ncbi:hypothetical protein ABNQ39_20695 [Azospirillum sp. A26]|uniref:hypothetical protein n=1 Tax=Azospirillum sp. A26 TaxID=3160607 RepID=UPI003671C5E3
MTNPQEALTRLTRWRKAGGAADYTRQQFNADVSALLDLVTRQQHALKNLIDIREGEGGTLRINPATGWPLAWGDMPMVEAPHDR